LSRFAIEYLKYFTLNFMKTAKYAIKLKKPKTKKTTHPPKKNGLGFFFEKLRVFSNLGRNSFEMQRNFRKTILQEKKLYTNLVNHGLDGF